MDSILSRKSRNTSGTSFKQTDLSRSALRIILASCMALSILSTSPLSWATDSHNPSSHRLINQQRIQEMKEQAAELRERLKDHQSHRGGVPGSFEALQAKVVSLETSLNALLSADTTILTNLQAAQAQISALQAKVVTLESKPTSGGGLPDLDKYVSIHTSPINGVNGPHIIFKGVNVHVQSGSGATVDTTGLGNLIIGYNETDPAVGLIRTGSHNLVSGEMNSFSSSSGLVFGLRNSIRGQHATILSGERNVASGQYSSILGGGLNTASGQYSTVYGGQQNTSSTDYAVKPQLQTGGSTSPAAF
jgi:hypothetical protein